MGLILVDSCVWIDHIRSPEHELVRLAAGERVLQHPFVTTEVALGSMNNRLRIVAMLNELAQAPVSDSAAVLDFIAESELAGTGIGMVDVHLLASACSFEGAAVWTRDKRLARQAERLGLRYAAG